MKFHYVISLSALVGSLCVGQAYYPLEVGNRWDYGELDFTPGGPAGQFTYQRTVSVIADSVMPNGKQYAVLTDGSFLRQQDDTVYAYSSSEGEVVLYDFSRQNGDTLRRFTLRDTLTAIVYKGVGSVFGISHTIWTFYTVSSISSMYSFITIADRFGRTYGQWEPGYNEYCLGAIVDGVQFGTINAVAQPTSMVPTRLWLSQNFPNPFNPSTTIRYSLPTRSRVRLTVYNILGQVVAELVKGKQAAGWNEVIWNATVSSGLYFYRLEAVSMSDARKCFVDVKKMVLLK